MGVKFIKWKLMAARFSFLHKKYNEEIGLKGSGIILFNGNNFLLNNIKECVRELYTIFKQENCNIKPKIQKI